MKNLKKFSVCLVSGITILGTVSFARTGTVNAPNGLVLREKAAKGANPITTVDDNKKVEIIEENGEWYKVKYGSYEGYMFAEYVEAEEIVEEEPIVEEEKPAEEVGKTQEQVPESEDEQSVEPVKTYPQNIKLSSDIKIHIMPSITSKVMENVEKSKTITVNYELNDWINVTYNNTEGWVRKYYINVEVADKKETSNNENKKQEEKEENKEETVQKQEQKQEESLEGKKAYIDVKTYANIRKKANTSADVIATLPKNTEIIILGEEKEFYKIEYKDMIGYIAKSLVSDKEV